jgi:hypothetical protein
MIGTVNASVFPEPVGAEITVLSPVKIALNDFKF